MPRTVGERESLLGELQKYFAAHPEHEVAAAPFHVTAARAGGFFTALSAARNRLALAARTTSAQALGGAGPGDRDPCAPGGAGWWAS